MNSRSQFTPEVIRFVRATFGAEDDALADARRRAAEQGLPLIEVAPEDGAILGFLARAIGARRIVEIGTLFGYSAIWMARSLPPEGRLITFELEEARARLARTNFEDAGVADRVETVVGAALDRLDETATPVDMVFIDADKESYPAYLSWARAALRPGGVVAVDNAFWDGAVVEPAVDDRRAGAIRRLLDELLTDDAWHPAMIPTLDGLAIGLRTSAP